MTGHAVGRPVLFPARRAMTEILRQLAEVLEQRKGADPASSYVAGLYDRGLDAILKKVGEEATETILAAKGGDPREIVVETADLWFHTLIMLAQQGLGPDQVLKELARRFGLSGLDGEESITMGIGGISIWSLLLILLIVVLLFGTKKIRNIGGDLGSALKNFKSAMRDGEEGKAADPGQLEQGASGSENVTAKEKDKASHSA